MDSVGRATRRFERLLFRYPHQPMPVSEADKVIAAIIFRPEEQAVDIVRKDEKEVAHAKQITSGSSVRRDLPVSVE
jgi:hypothetical protein